MEKVILLYSLRFCLRAAALFVWIRVFLCVWLQHDNVSTSRDIWKCDGRGYCLNVVSFRLNPSKFVCFCVGASFSPKLIILFICFFVVFLLLSDLKTSETQNTAPPTIKKKKKRSTFKFPPTNTGGPVAQHLAWPWLCEYHATYL